jgi:heme-binding NEAT domain protein
MKFKAVNEFFDQDRKTKIKINDIWVPISDFEKGRHLANNNVIPVNSNEVERSVKKPYETRKKRGRPKKSQK